MTDKNLTPIKESEMNRTETMPVTPMSLVQIAVSQGADIDKLEKLMDMQMKWEENEAKKAFVASMSAFRSKCPTIKKDTLVDFTSQKGRTTYKHASLAGAINQIKDLLGECGLSHSWRTNQEGASISVTCTVTHSMGHSESTTLIGAADPSGGKNPIQATGSTVQYLQRYTLFSILGLAAAEDDDGAGAMGYINDDQVDTLRDLISDTGSDVSQFLKWANADELKHILSRDYGKCEAALKSKVKK